MKLYSLDRVISFLNYLFLGVIISFVFFVAIYGCGHPRPDRPGRDQDGGCTTYQTDTGAVVECRDGTKSTITNGSNGTNGQAGASGTDGVNGTNGTNGTDGVNGTNGQDGAQGEKGDPGEQGPAGRDGLNGVNGTDGINGADGAPGMPGTPGGSILTPIVPCPTKAGSFPEILWCVDGSLYAVFSENGSALGTRNSLIPAGTYQTTDGRSCIFKVTSGCNISY